MDLIGISVKWVSGSLTKASDLVSCQRIIRLVTASIRGQHRRWMEGSHHSSALLTNSSIMALLSFLKPNADLHDLFLPRGLLTPTPTDGVDCKNQNYYTNLFNFVHHLTIHSFFWVQLDWSEIFGRQMPKTRRREMALMTRVHLRPNASSHQLRPKTKVVDRFNGRRLMAGWKLQTRLWKKKIIYSSS